jgi:hypothetical protein
MKLTELTPENWEDITKLKATATNAEIIAKVNELTDIVNQVVKNTIGI